MSPRGAPENVGDNFSPSHPVIRTHPVTGWKSLFAGVGLHVTRINDVYAYEDQMIRDYVLRLITRNHDSVARMHWTKQACAIWSNACTLHAATVCLRATHFPPPLSLSLSSFTNSVLRTSSTRSIPLSLRSNAFYLILTRSAFP